MHPNKFLISNKKIIITVGLLVGIIIVVIFNIYSLSKTTISSKSRASEISPTINPCLQKEKGDANCDNFITTTDRDIWREEYKQGKTAQLRADFNKDSLVNYDDYRVWFANWKK